MRWVTAFGLALILSGSSAHACLTYRSSSVFDLLHADAIVVGNVTNYELVTETSGRVLHGQFQIDAVQILTGWVDQPLTVNWSNHVFGIPETWSTPNPILFGLRYPDKRSLDEQMRDSFVYSTTDDQAPVILQRNCSSAHIYRLHSSVVKAVAILGLSFLFFLKWCVFHRTWNTPEKEPNAYVIPRKTSRRWGERHPRKT